MSLTAASVADQGVVSAGLMIYERGYNYPLTPVSGLITAPGYTTMIERWEGMDTPPAVTTYEVHQDANPRWVKITQPDGTSTVQRSYNSPGQWNDGLTYEVAIYSNGKLFRQINTHWERGSYAWPRRRQVDVIDELGQKKATQFSYGAYDVVTEVREYDYGDAQFLMRRVRTEYVDDGNYYNKRLIMGLPTVVEIYEGNSATPTSRTEYRYDEHPLVDSPNVVQHTMASDPYRGNLTQVTRYTDAAHRAGPIISQLRYDITGNVVKVWGACCELTQFSYTPATQYAYPTAQSHGGRPSLPSTADYHRHLRFQHRTDAHDNRYERPDNADELLACNPADPASVGAYQGLGQLSI
jgi:hypothetical protein